MEERLPCPKHEEQIKTLFRQDEALTKRIDGMDNMKDIMYSLDKNLAIQTQILQSLNERMDEQHEINIKVNENLTKLAQQYDVLDNKVDVISNETEKLTKKVNENEGKHNVDLRDIEKKKYTDVLFKYILPTGGGLIILQKLLEMFLESWKG